MHAKDQKDFDDALRFKQDEEGTNAWKQQQELQQQHPWHMDKLKLWKDA